MRTELFRPSVSSLAAPLGSHEAPAVPRRSRKHRQNRCIPSPSSVLTGSGVLAQAAVYVLREGGRSEEWQVRRCRLLATQHVRLRCSGVKVNQNERSIAESPTVSFGSVCLPMVVVSWRCRTGRRGDPYCHLRTQEMECGSERWFNRRRCVLEIRYKHHHQGGADGCREPSCGTGRANET